MSSPRTFKINKLRRKNRALLDQLESNSALLECRLKKLKHTAKAEKHSDKSWEDLPPSPLKRKFECWKARNYSGQVSTLLHRDLCDCAQNSKGTMDAQVQLKENVEENSLTSPTKRTRHNVRIVSSPRKKCPSKSFSSLKSSITVNTRKRKTRCPKCHCRNTDETSLNEDESSSSSPTCVCNVLSPKSRSIEKEEKLCMNNKRLEAVGPEFMLNYSPKSVFLKRLKKRSQTSGNLLSPGNLRKSSKTFPTYAINTETEPAKATEMKKVKTSPKKIKANVKVSSPTKKASMKESSSIKYNYFDETGFNDGKVTAGSSRPGTTRSPVRDLHGRCEEKSPIRDILSKPLKLPCRDLCSRTTRAKSAVRDFYSKSPPKDIPSRSISAKETTTKKRVRRRVCYRKNCYCKGQERKPKSTKKIVEDVEENLIEDLSTRDVSSSEEPHKYHCCCHCDRRKKSPPPEIPLLMTDTISNLVDNEIENKYIRGRCCDFDKESKRFNKLNEFRQSHYFDCHAHPSSLSLDSARNWESLPGHKCVHKYTVDDRFFAKPLYSDHRNNSRCTVCHLPYGGVKARLDGLLPITLPSKLDNTTVQVSVPLEKNKRMSPRSSPNSSRIKSYTDSRSKTNDLKAKSRLNSHTIGDFKAWMPPPADSLALRYQKGVAKWQ